MVPNKSRSVPNWLVRRIHRHADPSCLSDPNAGASVAGHAQSGLDNHDSGGSGRGLGHPVLAVGRVVRIPGPADACSHCAGRNRGGLSRLRGIVQTHGDHRCPATCCLELRLRRPRLFRRPGSTVRYALADVPKVAPTALIERPRHNQNRPRITPQGAGRWNE